MSSKHHSILEAFAELSSRVEFCLKEGNVEAVLNLETKKETLLGDLAELNDAHPLGGEAKQAFDEAIRELMEKESAHSAELTALMEANRSEYRGLSKRNKSMGSFRKAYGSKDSTGGGSSKLSSQA